MRNEMNVFSLLCRSSYGLSLLISNKEHKSHVVDFFLLLFLPACKILSIIPNHGLWTRQRFILIIISYMASCPRGKKRRRKKNAFENPIDFQRLGSGRGCCSIWFITMKALRVLAGRGGCSACNLGQRWYECLSVAQPLYKSCLFWFHYLPIHSF